MFAMLVGYALLTIFLAKLMWIFAQLQMVVSGLDETYTWDGAVPSRDYLVIGTILLLGGVIFA